MCIGCGRTKKDEKAWKHAETAEEKLDLLRQCLQKTEALGTRGFWEAEYRRKCRKKGLDCPLDFMNFSPSPS